ncbi:MAG: hypothetical protein ABI854_08225 [Betaproteobacteria bacterium]
MTELMRYEGRTKPLLSRAKFFRRLLWSVLVGAVLVALSLCGGMLGYHFLERLPWLDAFLNASMILSGMGPLANPQSVGGKLFAGFYALYSGLFLILVAGLMFAPIVHRFLHRFHIDDTDEKPGAPPAKEKRRARRTPK